MDNVSDMEMQEKSTADMPPSWPAHYWPCLWLLLAVAWVYWPVRHFPLVWYDDDLFLLKNTHLRSGLDGETLRWAFTGQWRVNWIPLTWLSWLVQKAAFGGWSAGAMHTVGVALHGLNAVLVWLWLRRVGLPAVAVLGAASVFALHPLNVEAVAWVTAQKDTLSLAFALGTLLAWEGRRWGWCVVWFTLAVLSKQSVVALPLCLWLKAVLADSGGARTTTWQGWRTRGREALRGPQGRALLLLLAVAGLAAAMALSSNLVSAVDREAAMAQPFARRSEATLLASALLLWRVLWPTSLHCHYDWPNVWPPGQGIAAMLTLLVVSWALWRAWARQPRLHLAVAGWLWFLLSLVPMTLPARRGAWVAERFFYSSGLGLILALGVGISLIGPGLQQRRWLTAALLIWLMAIMTVAREQVQVWRNSETLLGHCAELEPWSPHAQALLATYAMDKGDHALALSRYQAASRLAPGNAHYLSEQGMLLGMSGKLDKSVAMLRRAVQLDPKHPVAANNLATALREQGHLIEALNFAELALQLAPMMPEAHLNAAMICERLGRAEDAARHGAEWQRLMPREEKR